jgi:large subunit ribosomal protein L32
MAVPKRKTPKAKQRTRRSHHGLSVPSLVACPRCRSMHVNHSVCNVCGTYHGREILDLDREDES